MPIKERLYNYLIDSRLIPPCSHILVAVSGGADSVALLCLLHELSSRLDLHLHVAHLDHGLRKSSHEDADFVVTLAKTLGLKVSVDRQNVAHIARLRKKNLEEVARNLRREFLELTAKKYNCSLVALGHNADDQAETFLMRLIRGSGTKGLGGMRPKSGLFVRPLLDFYHDELVDYLECRNLSWHEDESNQDISFTRNRVRHQLLPILKNFNPKIVKQIDSLCEQLQVEEDFWEKIVRLKLNEIYTPDQDNYFLDRRLLAETDPALAGRVVRMALSEARGNTRSISATHIRDVLKLAREETPQAELHLPGIYVLFRYNKILLSSHLEVEVKHFESVLDREGAYELPDGNVLEVSFEKHSGGENALAVEFDGLSIKPPLLLRKWQAGDRFQPSGMAGTKKLQDFFVDNKMSREERNNTLLLTKNDTILWVVGLRRCEGWRKIHGKPILRVILRQRQ